MRGSTDAGVVREVVSTECAGIQSANSFNRRNSPTESIAKEGDLAIDEGTVQDHRQVTAYQNQITAGDRFPIIRPQIAQGTVLEQNGHAQQADIDQL